MYNRLMDDKEINVKVGDRVAVQGYKGIVTDVYRGMDTDWNGQEYVKVPGSESTSVKVHFDESQDIAGYGQYQDGYYGLYKVI